MKLNNEDYVARIANASGVQLTVITHEIAVAYMEQAKNSANIYMHEFEQSVKNAQLAVGNLIDTLDMQYEISRTLMSLYVYVNKLLMRAYFSKTSEPLAEAAEIMQTLLSGWVQVEKEREEPPLMENVQQIFAGLTYSTGGLNEYVEEDGKRGFKA